MPHLFSHLAQESKCRAVSNTNVLPAPSQKLSISPGCDPADQKQLGGKGIAEKLNRGTSLCSLFCVSVNGTYILSCFHQHRESPRNVAYFAAATPCNTFRGRTRVLAGELVYMAKLTVSTVVGVACRTGTDGRVKQSVRPRESTKRRLIQLTLEESEHGSMDREYPPKAGRGAGQPFVRGRHSLSRDLS